jgi:hypothetical protein
VKKSTGSVLRIATLLAGASSVTGCLSPFVEIASGFDIDSNARPALAEDGRVVAAALDHLLVGNGLVLDTVDLVPHGLEITASPGDRPVQIRSEGDIVMAARHPGAPECLSFARGAYRVHSSGGPLTTLFEACSEDTDAGLADSEIALSPNGTVAFSAIRNGDGAVYRGPATGPVSVLRSGTGTFFNTGAVDVNDAGRVTVQMEYFDGFAGGLMRGILAFDTPEQAKETLFTPIEKLGIGTQPPHAINAGGTVVFSVNSDLDIHIGGDVYHYEAGVYTATPTLFNTPKMLTLVAGLGGGYCGFGGVDINSAGVVVFEAQLAGGFHCGSSSYDGLFKGPDPRADAIVLRGERGLGGHQYFDSIRLGQINGAGQVAFLTTYSEPLVDPIKVWRVKL